MRVGVFTALLSQLPLDKVLEKLKTLDISTVELGTGNYPGDPHCKLSMLENEKELKECKKKLDDNGFTISALSCHGNPLHPDAARRQGISGDQQEDHPAGREARRARGDRLLRLPGRSAKTPSIRIGSPARGRPSISTCSTGSGTRR